MEKLPTSEYSERKREGLDDFKKSYYTHDKVQDISYPKALSKKYYEEHRNKSENGSKDWYVWNSFGKYAQAVREFYCAVMAVLNKTVYMPVDLPEYILETASLTGKELETNMPMLEALAQNMVKAEDELLTCLDRNRTSIAARCNKHKTLNELRDYAAKAWMVYDNFKVDNFYHAVIDFNSRNQDKDMTKDRDIALVTMGHYKAKNFVRTKVNGYFSTNAAKTPFQNRHGRSIRIYEDLDAGKLFTELMEMFNGYNYQEREEEIKILSQNATEELPKQIIEFYKNFADVKRVYKKLLYMFKEYQEGYVIDNYTDESYLVKTGMRRNLYEVAVNYFKELTHILTRAQEVEGYKFVLKDIYLLEKLEEAIEKHKDIYAELENNKQQAMKHFGLSNN